MEGTLRIRVSVENEKGETPLLNVDLAEATDIHSQRGGETIFFVRKGYWGRLELLRPLQKIGETP